MPTQVTDNDLDKVRDEHVNLSQEIPVQINNKHTENNEAPHIDTRDIELISEDEDEEDDEDDNDDMRLENLDFGRTVNVNVQQKLEARTSNSQSPPSMPLPTDQEYWFSKLPDTKSDYPVTDSIAFTWEVKDYIKLRDQKINSPVFKCGGVEWQMLMFPRGNESNTLALYLAPVFPQVKDPKSDKMVNDPEWSCCAVFGLLLWNPDHPSILHFNKTNHRFNHEEPDWGFSNFVDLKMMSERVYPSDAFPSGVGFLSKDKAVNVTCYIRKIKDTTGVLWHNLVNYDSRRVTGFTGLRNQGATCYLNSLLQSYHFTTVFKKSVFKIPTSAKSSDVTTALQKLFYELQVSSGIPDTAELTRSFGWDDVDKFTQHDVQELNRILMDKLEEKMKGTVVKDALNKTFVGKMKSYIKCVNVDYESSRVEDFWDIQLNVKGLNNLQASFESYISKEMLDGENKYDAANFGLQDAEKGVVFESFPNVLHLQLKRFDYDFMYDSLVKINERHEYPENIDLKPYLDQSNSEILKEDWEYELFAVLIHAGDISSGHYYAMIKPAQNSGWFKFDDERVTRVTNDEVFEQNFGLDEIANENLQKLTRSQYAEYQIRRQTSAYMLVYYRKSKIDEILCDFDEKVDIPDRIKDAVEKEYQAMVLRQKEINEMHLYLKVNLYGPLRPWLNYQGFDLGNNKSNHPKWSSSIHETPGELAELRDGAELYGTRDSLPINLHFPPKFLKVLKTCTLEQFFNDVVNLHSYSSIPKEEFKYFRLWVMAHRRNETSRPDIPIGIKKRYFDIDSNTALVVDASGKVVVEIAETGAVENADLEKEEVHVLKVENNFTMEQLLNRFSAKKSAGLFLWVEDVRYDLKKYYEFVTKNPIKAEYPKNFLGFKKHFEDYKNAVYKSPCDDLFNPAELGPSSQEILIFIKYFDKVNQTLTGLSHIVVSKNDLVSSIVPYINKLLGNEPEDPLSIYEEIKPTSIEIVDRNKTFGDCELISGDILVVRSKKIGKEEVTKDSEEKRKSTESNGELGDYVMLDKPEPTKKDQNKFEKIPDLKSLKDVNIIKSGDFEFPLSRNDVLINRDKLIDNALYEADSVQDFYRNMKFRIHIILRPARFLEGDVSFIASTDDNSSEYYLTENFEVGVWVAPQTTYQEIAAVIGKRLNINSNTVRLFIVPDLSKKSFPLKSKFNIGTIVGSKAQLNGSLNFEFEILKIGIDEFENLKPIKISWLPSGILHEHVHEFMVEKESTLEELLQKLMIRIGRDTHDCKKLVVWKVLQCRITKTFGIDTLVKFLPSKIYVRPLDDEELQPIFRFLYSDDEAKAELKVHPPNTQLIETIQFYKDPSKLHGIPFHFTLIKGEKYVDTKKRIQQRLSLGVKEFSKVHVGVVDQKTANVRYCNDDKICLFDEVSVDDLLFLNHPDRTNHHQSNGGGAIKIN